MNVMGLLLKNPPIQNKEEDQGYIDLKPNYEPLVRRYAPIWRDWVNARWIQDDGTVDAETWKELIRFFTAKYEDIGGFRANWVTTEGISVYVMEYDCDAVYIVTKNVNGPETVWSFGILSF